MGGILEGGIGNAEGGKKRGRGAQKRWRLEQPGFWFGDHIYRACGKEELLGQFEFKES
jgi:hypothetical protein